jgi:hypothetical protein
MKAELIESRAFDPGRTPDIMCHVRMLCEAQRQVSIAFDDDGNAIVSSPMVGNRSPANPQPTPPVTQAMRKVA